MLIAKESDSRKKRLLGMISVSNKSMLNEVSNYSDYIQLRQGGFSAKQSTFNLEQVIN